MMMREIQDAASLVQEHANERANIIFGASIDEQATGITVTIIAAGFSEGDVASSGTEASAEVENVPNLNDPVGPTLAPLSLYFDLDSIGAEDAAFIAETLSKAYGAPLRVVGRSFLPPDPNHGVSSGLAIAGAK